MSLKPLGDSAWLVEYPDGTPLGRVLGLVAALDAARPAGVCDVVSSFASVAVHFEAVDGLEIREWIESAMEKREIKQAAGAPVEIPVSYGGADGPDLEEVAARAGLTTEQVIELHCGARYTVAALGFSPGFPYLAGLPEPLNVPRRSTPRLSVPAGSVAVAAGQAGIYPFSSPGGWHVLGRTGVKLFDSHAAPPSLLKPGDRVRFVRVDHLEIPKRTVLETSLSSERRIEVVFPGGFTTVQDLGRPGYEAFGVSPGGAADRASLRLANLAVGNDEGAAALEICASGPVLRFHAEAVVGFVDGDGKPRRVAAGEVVDFSRLNHGVRAYLAVAGGLVVPQVLGSAATDPGAGFGGHHGRALQSGDGLEFGKAGRVPTGGHWHLGRAGRSAQIELRFLAGVQQGWFSEQALRLFQSAVYQVTPLSDRMGARLSGDPLPLDVPREMVSQPVACGSVQVPPDGQPIVLLAGRQTIGGYPQIGHVISTDLPKLARAWPGTRVTFREITWQQAQDLRRQEEQDFARLRNGLELLKPPTCTSSI